MNKSRFLILVVIVIVELIFISGVSDHAFCQSGQLNGHEYVDLGLPSGLLWATCNIGANSPEEYGNYYAWGETSTKDIYNEKTYKYFKGPNTKLTKYNFICYYDGKFDRLTTLEDSDDVVNVNWGSDWRMPTWDEIEELYSNCTHEWTTMKGVKGRLFTGSNGNSIFLPAARFRYDSDDSRDKAEPPQGIYWSSSLDNYGCTSACGLFFDSDNCGIYVDVRVLGLSVRAVCPPKNYIKETFSEPTGYANGYGYIDLGLPSGTKWAICNVGALKPSDEGYYFAWGETKPKKEYGENYKFNVQSITLPSKADAATANMGAGWRMPTETEMDELIDNCTITKVIRNGVIGRLFTGPNGNSIFLPAAGYFHDGCLLEYNFKGFYWSSSLNKDNPRLGCCIFFESEEEYDSCFVTRVDDLYCGFSVRAVYVK